MNDEYFVAELYSRQLLPGDLKNEIKSLNTSAKKLQNFLIVLLSQVLQIM